MANQITFPLATKSCLGDEYLIIQLTNDSWAVTCEGELMDEFNAEDIQYLIDLHLENGYINW